VKLIVLQQILVSQEKNCFSVHGLKKHQFNEMIGMEVSKTSKDYIRVLDKKQ
jgi:hypothetical protein